MVGKYLLGDGRLSRPQRRPASRQSGRDLEGGLLVTVDAVFARRVRRAVCRPHAHLRDGLRADQGGRTLPEQMSCCRPDVLKRGLHLRARARPTDGRVASGKCFTANGSKSGAFADDSLYRSRRQVDNVTRKLLASTSFPPKDLSTEEPIEDQIDWEVRRVFDAQTTSASSSFEQS
jgi:hypothetical protein